MTPTIHPAGGEAAQTLAALHAACLEPGWAASSVASFLAVPGSFALLAWGDGENADRISGPAGFILCRVAAGVCDLAAMGVVPAARRQGLGRALLAAACTEARRLGAGEMFLEVAEANVAARALYLSEGFTEAGRRAHYYAGADREKAPEDALLLRRAL